MGVHHVAPKSGLAMKGINLLSASNNLAVTDFHIPAINPSDRLRDLEDHD
jgi:hypothetical protein